MSLTLSPLDAGVALFCLSVSALLYHYKDHGNRNAATPPPPARGYILENQVTHARLLPTASAHAFTYPTISLLVSLNALEKGELDLGRGWVFSYGGIRGRLIGLQAAPYLSPSSGGSKTGASGAVETNSIRRKLEELLRTRGFGSVEEESVVDDAWMMTMPSFLGFEGINPLTMYFCYKSRALRLIVFEIHNTFGETHVHVLEVGRNEDDPPSRPNGFDHQWTFAREFHVSPFNDRSGFYTISIKSPTHPPISDVATCVPPRPAVRVHLHTASPDSPTIPGPLKLTALLRPTAAHPLTTANVVRALARAPFALFLSLPRILAEAWTLHYRKRLDVFTRPEPLPPSTANHVASSWAGMRQGGGVKWLSEGPLERYARRRVEAFLHQRVEDLYIQVSLAAADPAVPDLVFLPRGAALEVSSQPPPHLVVSYLSPRFFTLLFACPSPEHALLLGSDTEGIFSVSSRELFVSTFSSPDTSTSADAAAGRDSTPRRSTRQHLRARPVPAAIPLHIPATHPLDSTVSASIFAGMKATLVLHILFFFDGLERWLFAVARARVVPGDEPWTRWERASRVFGGQRGVREQSGCGSIRREE
ncbi:hypothetical protein FPV67DRAFT_1584507 [Lyophyllum atratum]|nr:hypothetical protein FPV67DRAFT_1584507 [Lyophyllum atratum]